MFPHGQNKEGAARKEMDLVELEKLCGLQCTQADIAGWFNVTRQTIENRIAETGRLYEHEGEKLTFREIMDRGYAKGRVSLRRHQMAACEAGQPTMLVWLGKNILGQKDNLEISGPAGGPIEANVTSDPHQRVLGELSRIAAARGEGADRQDPDAGGGGGDPLRLEVLGEAEPAPARNGAGGEHP